MGSFEGRASFLSFERERENKSWSGLLGPSVRSRMLNVFDQGDAWLRQQDGQYPVALHTCRFFPFSI